MFASPAASVRALAYEPVAGSRSRISSGHLYFTFSFRFISICLSDAHPRAGRRSRQSWVSASLSPFHIYLFVCLYVLTMLTWRPDNANWLSQVTVALSRLPFLLIHYTKVYNENILHYRNRRWLLRRWTC